MKPIIKLKELSELMLYDELREKLHKKEYFATTIAIAYILQLSKKYFPIDSHPRDFNLTIPVIEDLDIKLFVAQRLENVLYYKTNEAYFLTRTEDFIDYILTLENDVFDISYPTTPNSVVTIANKILAIKTCDSVMSAGEDLGLFIYNDDNKDKIFKYDYFAENRANEAIAKIKLEMLKQKSGFEGIISETTSVSLLVTAAKNRYDKVFINMPFQMRADRKARNIKQFDKFFPGNANSISLDWPYMLRAVRAMKNTGKTVALAIYPTTNSREEREFRKRFVEHFLIEAVIALPSKLYQTTPIQTVLYVFSNGNTSIKFVDATEIHESGINKNTLNDENIATILAAYETETENISRDVDVSEVMNNDFVLTPSRYLSKTKYSNGIALKEIASIRRGAPLRAYELEALLTTERTNFQHLQISDINDGIIASELSYINAIDDSLAKFVVKEHNLVLSKMGMPFKIATVRSHSQQIVASGNLYILEIDESKVDPYYLQAFLQSNNGQKILAGLSTSTKIASLSIKQLSELIIPLPPLKEQQIIGKKFKDALSDIKWVSSKLENTRRTIASFFGEQSPSAG